MTCKIVVTVVIMEAKTPNTKITRFKMLIRFGLILQNSRTWNRGGRINAEIVVAKPPTRVMISWKYGMTAAIAKATSTRQARMKQTRITRTTFRSNPVNLAYGVRISRTTFLSALVTTDNLLPVHLQQAQSETQLTGLHKFPQMAQHIA